ncbi:hypothetical protein LX32DRAFT_683205 [Colletotrichum zoysiae]|uniref:Uncharacterized protein n=1 Tax=Colletotrichum zoysiae TaxID=1216348 RepID=A0AAD9M0U4_9PEZI|nr:hypothetical protein LX32DRAFT_683205 [Colletotrichum zoysiae]
MLLNRRSLIPYCTVLLLLNHFYFPPDPERRLLCVKLACLNALYTTLTPCLAVLDLSFKQRRSLDNSLPFLYAFPLYHRLWRRNDDLVFFQLISKGCGLFVWTLKPPLVANTPVFEFKLPFSRSKK